MYIWVSLILGIVSITLTFLSFRLSRVERAFARALAFIMAGVCGQALFTPELITETGQVIALEGVQPLSYLFFFVAFFNVLLIFADAFKVRI